MTGVADDGIPVDLPSGAVFLVLTEEERNHVEARVGQYQTQFEFQNVSDLAGLDLIIEKELLAHRTALYLSRGKDYFGEAIDEVAQFRWLKELSAELRQLKKSLGMDKVSRDKAKGEGSIPEYLEKLRTRALTFGYMRNGQANKSIELSMELTARITLYVNCTPEERVEMKVTEKDIIEWIQHVYIPAFEAIDAEFREEQKTWVRDM